MAKKIGVKEEEYQTLTSGVKSCHDDILSELESTMAKIQSLSTKGGGIYLDQVTTNINAVVKELNSMKSTMKTIFNTHETVIKSFQKAIDHYDTNC